MVICVKCKRRIQPGSNYHKNIEYDKGKKVRADYIHQKCWEEFTLQTEKANLSLNKSLSLLNSMEARMVDMGMVAPKEFEIK